MTNARRLLVVSSVLAVSVLVGQGTAQSHIRPHATISFEFWIEGNRLPAGDYQIEQIESIPSYLLFINTDGNIAAGAFTVALDDKPVKDSDARLIFRIQDGKHYLYGGWGPYGKHVLKAESKQAAPSGDSRVEVPLTFH